METRTILNAYADLNFWNGRNADGLSARKARQMLVFRDELLRRGAQRDMWAAARASDTGRPLEMSPAYENIRLIVAGMSDDWKADDMVSGSFVRKYLGLDESPKDGGA